MLQYNLSPETAGFLRVLFAPLALPVTLSVLAASARFTAVIILVANWVGLLFALAKAILVAVEVLRLLSI